MTPPSRSQGSWSLMVALDSTKCERRKTLIMIINNQLHVSSLLMGLFRNIKCNKNWIKMENLWGAQKTGKCWMV